ncbi:coatomer subunit zeta-2 isoform X1 [Pelobates cultripes]|uniref:Coatomer subunit zeta n=1 Tax=Pelobates cultripes TaxID=61616 RepID=A0AAD1WF02_PELCU|nr:coatomer subunit zeta-2 isoform X1 [Pelobates cultripes]
MNSLENLPDPSLYTVRAAIILDHDGHRLLAKYYGDSFPSLKEQREFEKRISHMTQRSECEVLLVDGVTALCQRLSDVTCYIVGGPQENELLLLSALTCICESLCHMLRKNVDRSSLMENMDTVCLILDEIIDQGVILESESEKVVQRLSFKTISEPAFGFVLFDYLTGSGDHSDSRKRGDLE